MASCAVCTDRLAAFENATHARSKRSRALAVAASLLIITIIVLTQTPVNERLFSRNAVSRVASAAETLDAWPLEGRLTGDFPDLPQKATVRAASVLPRRPYELEKTRIEIEAAVQTIRNPADLHALGLAHLLLGQEARAVTALSDSLSITTGRYDEQTAIARSSDAALLSNFSAALLQRGHAAPSSRDLLLALESAERAWSLERTPETAWNRAAAMEALHLPDDASEAWNVYLQLDRESPWSVTAKTRLELLRRPRPAAAWADSIEVLETAARAGDGARVRSIASAFPGRVRAQVENELLPCWGGAVLSGQSATAEDCLHRARVLAAALQDFQRDPLLSEAVQAIERSDGRWLADAHALYGRAQRAYSQGRFADARRDYRASMARFETARSPFAILARLYAAGSAYNLNEYGAAVEEIAELFRTTRDLARYPSACGRAHWTAGVSHAFLGNFDGAVGEYESAVQRFREAREHVLAVSMQETLAGAYEMMGDRDRAWGMRLEALAELADSGQPDHLQQTLAGGARLAHRYGFPAVARLFTQRELAVTRTQKPSAVRVAALARMAQLSRAEGDVRAAAHYAALASSDINRIEEPASRQFALSDPNVLRGVLPEQPVPRRLELLRDAVAVAQAQKNRYGIVEANLLLSREHARRGDAEAAIATLEEALQSVDIQEQSIQEVAGRDLILDEYRAANRDLLGLLVRRGHGVDALVVAERNRARTVGSGALGATGVQTESDLRILQRLIPSDTAVVYYATLEDRVLCWLITSGRMDLFQAIVSREQVRASADALSVAGADTFAAAAADASEWLVDPWIRSVSAQTHTLVFVTDDETANVPFNAMVAGSSMLIDRFGVLVAPSLAVHVAALERDRQLQSTAAGPLLVVAAVDGREDLNLEPLLRGRREVARFRTASNVRVLDAATRRDVTSGLPLAGAVHITTHAITNEDQPSLSALVLQRERDEDGLLYVHEIAGLQLRRTRMVFIAACEAARAGRKGREGTATIGRAFLAAGAPVVIGSTRDLNDATAAAIVDEFYRRVDAGADPVTALRQTQLSMKGRFAPVDWAALQVMGGISSREREPWLSNWK